MDGKEKIIARILEDANAKCQSILDEANKKADAISAQSQQTVAAERVLLDQKLKASAETTLRNALSNAKLEGRKYLLQQKQALIDKAYDGALDNLRQMSGKQYTAFVVKLLSKYAEDGEVVRISKRDANVITQTVVEQSGKRLTLSKQYADIDGGVLLEGNGYDKNLSLTALVRYARQNTDMSVAKILFGE